ncbi:MFS transporter [Rhodoferax lacus]|uniref:MFS transporter n=1 Tax=Rhodoferax lacus TaxID=2184758 RepID=A0A3E1RBG5_9BURK|nr:MFS transporter [Rhodoferax lacus]RFO96689.1 MFS transporter [Rhodoferax lacus]
MHSANRTRTVLTLGTAQTLAWASSYYLPAILAVPMARELGISTATVFAAFSVGLVISAFVGPRAGRAIDALGGRPVLALSNLVFAAGLVGLAFCTGRWGLFAAWMLMGLGMAGGLYEAAFATLVRLYGRDSRNVITGITLIAGFASTVGWPLSSALEGWLGWRDTCLVWAALHLLLGLPLNLSLPKLLPHDAPQMSPSAAQAYALQTSASGTQADTVSASPAPVPLRSAVLLSLVFALTWFISTAMAAHLPTLLTASGVGLSMAVTAGALIGPAQVAGRLLEFGVLRRAHPLLSARLAAVLHPLGALALLLLGPVAAMLFAVLHGAGNGVLTIAKGTLPLALFGPQGYGERQGLLMVPARLAQALAPWLFGLCVAHLGAAALWVSAALGCLVVLALWLLAQTPPPSGPDA